MGVGSFYHHIERLGPLVTQLEDRRYALTELGRTVVKRMDSDLDKGYFVQSKALRIFLLEPLLTSPPL